jgi:hypothetical protein
MFRARWICSASSRERRMNHYGYLAQRHWVRWLPHQYAAVEDPDSFFWDLGNRAEARIDELADQFAGDPPPGEGYLERVGRLGQARRQAEEIVLHEMILLEPEPGAGEDDETPEI